MELEELVMIGACTVLSNIQQAVMPTDEEITRSVTIAKKVWKEVVRTNESE